MRTLIENLSLPQIYEVYYLASYLWSLWVGRVRQSDSEMHSTCTPESPQSYGGVLGGDLEFDNR
jgi:hypothetical protein